MNRFEGAIIIDDAHKKPTEECVDYFEQKRKSAIEEYFKSTNKPKCVVLDAVILSELQVGRLQDKPVDNF